MTWTKKHDKFALACNLSESQQLVLRDALRKGKSHEPTEIEFDLRTTNKWIGKVRPEGAFHRKTITNAIAVLNEKSQGMVTVLKKYNPYVYKILIRPLSLVERIRGAFCASVPKLATEKGMYSNDHKNKSRELLLQNISKLDILFKKLGIHYTEENLIRIWRLADQSMCYVQGAVTYMLECHARKIEQSQALIGEAEGITIPEGWIYRCLEGGWHLRTTNARLPYLEGPEIYTFVDSLMGISPPKTGLTSSLSA